MTHRLSPLNWILTALLLLTGCTTPPQTKLLSQQPLPGIAPQKLLADTPFIPQRAYQCGPAALAMALQDSGVTASADELVPLVYVPDRQGSFQVEMMAAARRFDRLPLPISPQLTSLIRWLDAGKPVLVLQNLGLERFPKWHYAVAIGYDLKQQKIVLHSGETAHYSVSMALFERTWQRGSHWGIALLKPGELPVRDNPQAYFLTAAAMEETRPNADLQAIWRAGVEAWPDSAQLAMGLANHHYSLGDRPAARAAYQAIIDRHPTYLPAYNNLATLLTEMGLYDDAIAVAEQGLATTGSDIALQATLTEAQAAKARR